MNRWERVNCASLAAILVALLLLAGYSLPRAESATAATTPAAIEAVAVAETSAETEPSGVRDLTVGELMQDAWAAYATLPPAPAARGQFTIVPEYFAAYEGSAPTFTAGYFAIESKQFPGLFHAFHMVAAQRA